MQVDSKPVETLFDNGSEPITTLMADSEVNASCLEMFQFAYFSFPVMPVSYRALKSYAIRLKVKFCSIAALVTGSELLLRFDEDASPLSNPL